MRHVVSKNRENVPYEGCWGHHSYNFTCPTKDRIYVKVLRFVESHPGCSRKDILNGVWGKADKGSNSRSRARGRTSSRRLTITCHSPH